MILSDLCRTVLLDFYDHKNNLRLIEKRYLEYQKGLLLFFVFMPRHGKFVFDCQSPNHNDNNDAQNGINV